ncbi:Flp pilus assembly protein TadG [Rhizobium sp. SG_E_25_P2]|uniref:TadE/TadG family type IV pilus assembly protein n=1 Tax=Rhizobium sp. SG_E_25_P2 TaxID=2879942 RepID=UPI00247677CA|nr:pilus assembly protein [Rhizobium sp. SG_E_25_P2]MDH6268577.1 Flp pilus assembly protein TadG [Rhizobium sp. SG_E_25_P2]
MLRQFINSRDGNFALLFAIVFVALVGAVGASIDYARAYNIRSEMQTDIDAAVLFAASKMEDLSEDELKAAILKWIAVNTSTQSSVDMTDEELKNNEAYTASADLIDIDYDASTITATVTVAVPTTFMRILGVDSVNVSVSSQSTVGGDSSYINVYIVLDKSASMLLPSTTAGQTTMLKKASCVFACHTGNNYSIAVANNVTLRTDVQLDAVETLLDLIDDGDATETYIKVGVYTLGSATTGSSLLTTSYKTANGVHVVKAPTLDRDAIRTLLTSSSELSSSTSYDSTDFRALEDLATTVGEGGDGTTSASPKKIVMLITDGAQSSKGFITASKYYTYITPMNPSWCDAIKNNDVTMSVLYTEYLSESNSEYNATLAKTMSSSVYVSVWSGTLASAKASSVRRDYIETALTACASDSDYFVAADSASEIESGFSSLFTTYVSDVRLSQ